MIIIFKLYQFLPRKVQNLIDYIVLRNKSFSNFEDALASCNFIGYQDKNLIDTVFRKSIKYREEIMNFRKLELVNLKTLVPFIILAEKKDLNVLDFGGGAGAHYTVVRTVLGEKKPINWNVVETAGMVKRCRQLEQNGLRFFDSIIKARDNLGKLDLIFTSSALQYCSDPLGVLIELINLDAPYLYITRTPFLSDGETVYMTQTSRLSENGPGSLPTEYSDAQVKVPITFVSISAIETVIKAKYEISFTVNEGEINYFFGRTPMTVISLFCTRKDLITSK